jgi:uncharacterized membrane protein YtjA (UPF0391 family)
MLNRARSSLLIGLVAGSFGFTGLLEQTAILAQSVFYFCLAFSLLSALLGLFDAAPSIE